MNKILAETYEIENEIGSGSGGTVYKAFHKRLEKPVVIKKSRIRMELESEKRRETDILKNLRHTYLPSVLDYIEDFEEGSDSIAGYTYTVMDYIEGNTFQNILDSGKVFSQKEAVKYGTQLLEALVYLHTRKIPILHGDIKPDNIILTPDDNICLIDFNISGVLTNGKVDTIGYTQGYAAPEQIKAVRELHARILSSGKIYTSEHAHSNKINLQENKSNRTEYIVPSEKDGFTEVITPPDVKEHATEYIIPGDYNDTSEITCPIAGDENRTEFILPDKESTATEKITPRGENKINESFEVDDEDDTEISNKMPEEISKPYDIEEYEAMLINKSEQHIDLRADIFSVAAFLYRLVMGKRIPDDVRKAEHLLDYSNFSDAFANIVDKALSYDPKDRFQSAQEMLNALNNYAKTDTRYRRLVRRQNLVTVLLCASIGICLLIMLLGWKRTIIEKEQECVSTALTYYEEAEYTDALIYIDDVLQNRGVEHEGFLGELYFIKGNCLYEKEMYSEAVECFEKSIQYDTTNPQAYRDYAITLAVTGNTDMARDVFQRAEKMGLSGDQMDLIEAEIAVSNGDYKNAELIFRKLIDNTNDDQIKQRAYILFSRMYDELSSSEDGLKAKLAVLEEARLGLSQDKSVIVTQELAKTYISLYELKNEDSYAEKAIEVFADIIKRGWDNFNTWNNLVIMQQNIGDYDAAEENAHKMAERYSGRYEPYKRICFIEAAAQKSKELDDRNYQAFEDNYLKAQELYKSDKKTAKDDTEMKLLEDAYSELKQEGWL